VVDFRPLDEIQWPRFKNKLMGNSPTVVGDTDPLNHQLSIKLKLIENNEFNHSINIVIMRHQMIAQSTMNHAS
jgi:hypothetical protein